MTVEKTARINRRKDRQTEYGNAENKNQDLKGDQFYEQIRRNKNREKP